MKPVAHLFQLSAFLMCLPFARAEVPEFEPCAKDKAYQDFEWTQYQSYLSNNALVGQLEVLKNLHEPGFAKKAIDETRKELEARVDLKGSKKQEDSGDLDSYLKSEFSSLKAPTCYENPLTFWMLA